MTNIEATEAELNEVAQDKNAALEMAIAMLSDIGRGNDFQALDFVQRVASMRRALNYIPKDKVTR